MPLESKGLNLSGDYTAVIRKKEVTSILVVSRKLQLSVLHFLYSCSALGQIKITSPDRKLFHKSAQLIFIVIT